MKDNSSQSKVRVLWLAKGLGQGGMERLLLTHAQFGDRDRFDYHAAYLVDRPHTVGPELEGLGVTVHRLGRADGSGTSWVHDLRQVLRNERIDVVHAHSPLPASLARPLVRTLRPRPSFVYTEHNSWSRYAPPTRIANRMSFWMNDRAFAVSEECRKSMPARTSERVEVLIHGVDVDGIRSLRHERDAARAELTVPGDAILIGTVANLRRQKNYPMLLEAAALVRTQRQDVIFVAVGQGPLAEQLRQTHASSELGEGFRFLGFRSDVHRVMSAFDVLCFSSSHEGLPVALMEGKALGLPVVATAVGGLQDHIEQGSDGLLVPPDDPEALAGALLELVANSERRRGMGEASSRSADRYRADRAVERVEASYVGTDPA